MMQAGAIQYYNIPRQGFLAGPRGNKSLTSDAMLAKIDQSTTPGRTLSLLYRILQDRRVIQAVSDTRAHFGSSPIMRPTHVLDTFLALRVSQRDAVVATAPALKAALQKLHTQSSGFTQDYALDVRCSMLKSALHSNASKLSWLSSS